MRRLSCTIACAALALGMLAGCGGRTAPAAQNTDKPLQIVTTIFPEYDWVREIIGGQDADITLLMDSGADLHNYQPTAADLVKISECDLFIYVGGESDAWAQDALKVSGNKERTVIGLLDALGDNAKLEEAVEGMQADGDEAAYDEHVWLSLKNAQILVPAISNAIAKLDPDHAAEYTACTDAYLQQLSALDDRYAEAVSNAKYTALLFGDRFPFRYLADDYHLTYYAAFSGCSAESEASFETIRFLAQKADELNLPAVITLEGSDGKIAETIIGSTKNKDQQRITMNSMQSVTAQEAADGTGYLAIMEQNLEALKLALG